MSQRTPKYSAKIDLLAGSPGPTAGYGRHGMGQWRTWALIAVPAVLGQLQAAPVAASRVTASPDYAPAAWVPASTENYTPANRPHDHPIDMIIIHDTEDFSYEQTIQEFQDPSFGASAHYVVSNAGQVTQMVAEHDVAWHAGNWDYNTRAIGIEHEGVAWVPGSYTYAEYAASAALAASICSRWGVPMDRDHVIGHSEVPDPNNPGLYGGEDHHSDPGPYWDWTTYMSLAQQDAAALPSPPHIEPNPSAVGGDQSVTLSWSGRSCHSPITSYHVTGQPGNIVLDFPGTVASTTIGGLQNWVKYTFTVTATNSYGQDTETSNFVLPMPGLGGRLLSDPAVASGSTNRLDVVATGLDSALWHRWWNGTSWAAWESLGGLLNSRPSAVASATRVDVFGRGADGALWQRMWDGTSWHAWEFVGGALEVGTGPGSSTWSAQRIDVFVVGVDDALWHRWFDGSTWQPWESLGGLTNADPAAVSWGQGRIDVFVRGLDFALWHRAWTGTAWQPWESLGGYLTSGPTASSCAASEIDVFTNAPDGLWQRTFNGTWGSWQKTDGDWSNGPGAACRPQTTKIDVIRRGADTALWWLELG